MILSPAETERFYRIWWALLHYTNTQRRVLPDLTEQPTAGALSPSEAHQIRQVLWADDTLREAFIAENPAKLPPADLEIVASWQYRLAGSFFIFRHLKKYTIFLSQSSPPHAYGVLGLMSPIEEVIGPYLPIFVEAVLLPFEDKIIYDGLLSSYNVVFGSGIKADLDLTYRDAKEREGIITSLLPQAAPITEEQVEQNAQARNAKILAAFRKELYKGGLSPKTVEQHVSNIEAFANDYLLKQNPPRLLLDIHADDPDRYLGNEALSAAQQKAIATSFKRFVRFLLDSGRGDPNTAWEIQHALKSYGRRQP
jgi:hypothetical protein